MSSSSSCFLASHDPSGTSKEHSGRIAEFQESVSGYKKREICLLYKSLNAIVSRKQGSMIQELIIDISIY